MDKKTAISRIIKLLILTILTITTAGMFWEYLPKGSYYFLGAVGWFLFAYAFYLTAKEFIQDKTVVLISEYIFICTINNLADEVLFQNLKMDLAEIILFILITLFYIYRYAQICHTQRA